MTLRMSRRQPTLRPTTGDRAAGRYRPVRGGGARPDRARRRGEVRGSKVLRDGMASRRGPRAKGPRPVITNALIVDHAGVFKADIGDGRIVGTARPATRTSWKASLPAWWWARALEAVSAEGIVTAVPIDAHVTSSAPSSARRPSRRVDARGRGTGPATARTPPPHSGALEPSPDAEAPEACPSTSASRQGQRLAPEPRASRSRPGPA
jgi:hypothetical protein